MKKTLYNYNTATMASLEAGFTLIELLVVVAILGILAAIAIPQYEGYQAQAKINSVKTNQSNVQNYVAAEFAKCSSGATKIMGTPGANCTDAIGVIATAVGTYGTAQGWVNPYDATKGAVVVSAIPAPGAAVKGTTYVTSSGTDTILVQSFLDNGAGVTAAFPTAAISIVKE